MTPRICRAWQLEGMAGRVDPRMTEAQEKDAARIWKAQHKDHVKRLMKSCRYMYAPSGSDMLHPELWTGAHWNWLEQQAEARR